MLKSYLTVAWRNLVRQKTYSAVNIAGMAMGIACFVLLLLFVQDEFSYDRFNSKEARIYRIISPATGKLPIPLGSLLSENLPEVAAVVRILPAFHPLLISGEKRFYEAVNYVDDNFFEVFDLPFVLGDPRTALQGPYKLVISTDIAEKYFGSENPLGKTLSWDGKADYQISGVVKVPQQTHFHFAILASGSSMRVHPQMGGAWAEEQWSRGVEWYYKFTYVLLAEGSDPAQLPAKALDLIEKHRGHEAREIVEQWGGFSLQPLTDIHLYSHLPNELEANGDINTVYVSIAIALLILLISYTNFANLSTARSSQRVREVGIRKAIGAYREQLVQQFLAEPLLLSVSAWTLALVLVECTLPIFNAFTGKELVLLGSQNLFLLPGTLALVLFLGTLAASYPALVLSAYSPVRALKGRTTSPARGGALRRGLVAFQFAISIGLIIAAGVVVTQLDYLRQKKLGFNKDQIVVMGIRYPGLNQRMPLVQEALRQYPGVMQTASFFVLPSENLELTAELLPAGSSQPVQLACLNVEPGFIELFEMQMLAGRGFSEGNVSDTSKALIVNRAALAQLGVRSPEEIIGKHFSYRSYKGGASSPDAQVIGVVEDFNFESLHQQVRPMVLFYRPHDWSFCYTGVRVRQDQLQETLGFIRATWEEFVPEYPFTYRFLDEDFARLYRSEERLGTMLGVFAGFAVFVACLGVFGLAAFAAERRTKEIGIRKVLGASVSGIVMLLSKELTYLVLAANLIAWPLAWYAMHRWLESFAYRIDLGPGVFVLGGLLALLVAWLTVSCQAIRAARANPVEALRYE